MNKNFLLKSFSWVATSNLITKPIWVLLFIFAARVLGVFQYGIYTYAVSVVLIVTIFIDFGFDYIAIREISKNPDTINSYFNRVVFLRLLFFLFVLTAFLFYFFITNNLTSREAIVILVLLLFQTSTVLLTYFKSITSAFHQFDLYGKMMILEKLTLSFLGFIALIFSNDLTIFLTSLLTANIISLSVIFIIIKNKYSIKIYIPQRSELFGLLKEALPLIVMNIFIFAYFRIDVIIMNALVQDKVVVGLYGSIHRLVEMYMLVPAVLMSTAYPIINKYIEENKQFVSELVNKIFEILILITLPIALIIAFNSYRINFLLFGNEYKEGASGLIYIIWTILPLGLNYILGHLLISIKKQNICAWSVGFAALINIVLNLVLIPKYSFVGASIAALITEIIIFILYGYFVVKHYENIKLFNLSIKVIGITALNFIVFFFYLQLMSYEFLISILTLVILNIVLYILFKFSRPSEVIKFLKTNN